jgi:aminoglycoside phosphotransferase family enzyme/gluconate kinase
MSDQHTTQQRLLMALQSPTAYPHPVEHVERIETHISTVLLAGDYAYKIKKPLDLGFLDFSTLERRRFFCKEEIRLNRRLAPQIYERVVAFSGDPDRPVFDGTDPALEYAVRMHRFDPGCTLDRLHEREGLSARLMDTLTLRIADFHEAAEIAPQDSDYGTPAAVLAPMEENFRQIRALSDDPRALEMLEAVEAWTRTRFDALTPRLEARRREGRIRECHGDMHLANMALVDGEPLLFDGIEFNADMRWIDVVNDLAFFTMDLHDRGAHGLAARVLNTWLERTGDYAGLALLDFYQVYRAMVRAKVAAIRLGQEGLEAAEAERQQAEFMAYLQLARDFTRPRDRALFINHGFSGSGKTSISQPILEELGAVRIRSDVERKRMAGLEATQRGDAAVGEGLYSRERSEHTYDHLARLTGEILDAGHSVIVDATFLERPRRDRFAHIARGRGLPFVILDYQAPADLLRQWVRERTEANADASDADLSVLEHQLRHHDPLGDDEPVVTIDARGEPPLDTLRRIVPPPGDTGD